MGRMLIVKAEALHALEERAAAETAAGQAQRLLELSHPAAVAPLLVQFGFTAQAEDLLERAERGDLDDAANIQYLIFGYLAMNNEEKAVYWTRTAVEARNATIVGALRLAIGARSDHLAAAWRAVETELAVLPVPDP